VARRSRTGDLLKVILTSPLNLTIITLELDGFMPRAECGLGFCFFGLILEAFRRFVFWLVVGCAGALVFSNALEIKLTQYCRPLALAIPAKLLHNKCLL
jgi:hypothetical protein